MDDIKVTKKTVDHTHISQETKQSLTRLLSALVPLLVSPKISSVMQSMFANDGSDPLQFGIGITAMGMPLVCTVLWAAAVLRQERHVWKKPRHSHRHGGRSLWHAVRRCLYLALALSCPACIAVTIWHLIRS